MPSGASPGRIPHSFLFRNAYSPVSSEYREGVQTDAAECPSVNRIPSLASRSMLGVRICLGDAP